MATPTQPSVHYEGRWVQLKSQESVLQALLRSGFAIPHSCQAGACQSCLMQAKGDSKAAIPAAAQQGLTPAQRQQGMFLACCAQPTEPLTAALPDASARPTTEAEVVSIEPLNPRVLSVKMAAELNYEPGQFVNVRVESNHLGTIQRSYSLACAPAPNKPLELQIKLLSDGKFSQWLQREAQPGNTITLEGPHGLCHISDEDLTAPSLLLAGTGTGLAPLLAITEAAMAQSYKGEIHLLFANRHSDDFYCIKRLQDLAADHNNLKLHLLAQQADVETPLQSGDVYQYLKQLSADIDMSRSAVFLCGAESFVQKMRKACFLQGASMKRIRADAFIAS